MNKLTGIIAAFMLIAGTNGCTSMEAYFVDRGRDACDIFTVTCGLGAGAQARVGPIHGGLCLYHDVAGLRGGRFVQFPSGLDGEHGALESITAEATFLSYDYFDPNAFAYKPPERFKMFAAEGMPFLSFLSGHECRDSQKDGPILHSYYTQAEVAVAALGGARVGFNPGEILDFILGWTTLDIFKDDLGLRATQSSK